jgi:DNA-binding transcriptional ArsR family regulator
MDRTLKEVGRGPCSCRLPELIPENVQTSLDELGGVDQLPSLLPPDGELSSMAQAHKALADPLRLKVLHLLSASRLCVCVIRTVTDVEDSKLSYHLGLLRSTGLITSEREGNWMIYELTAKGRRWMEAEGVRSPP